MALSYKKRKLTKKEIEQEEAAKLRVAIWFSFMFIILILVVFIQSLVADQIVHKFKSPSFSGINTSSHY